MICMKKGYIKFMRNKFRIDFSKNTKILFYLRGLLLLTIPNFFYKINFKNQFNKFSNNEKEEIKRRLSYYNKIEIPFELGDNFNTISTFCKKEKKTTYYFDLLEYLKYFDYNYKISYIFGDVTCVPNVPSIVKSRPINCDNKNSIIMKLNKVRHFIFVKDKILFEDKLDQAVWRGKCYVKHRIDFVKFFFNSNLCNIGQVNTKGDLNVPWQKEKLSVKQQLKYKFLIAIEGNDVASNLKWAMSSNSVVMMAKPKYETWFMEGTLIENFHYVLLKDDYSDLEEKIEYFTLHNDKAINIINNAHMHVRQFLSQEKERFISAAVLKKYFYRSSQLILQDSNFDK